MIRTAVVGLTTAGCEHARTYRTHPQSDLVAVCDPDSAKAESLAAQLGVPAFSDYRDILRDARPDLCTIRLPQPDRESAIRAAVEAGVSVLTSLPAAATPGLVATIAESAGMRGVVLAADFHLRFNPAVAKALEWIAEGQLGRPLFINMNLWNAGQVGDDPHGLLRNLGAHGADMMRAFCGDVSAVQCFGTNAPGGKGWSSVQVNMRFADGAVGNLTTSYDMVPRHPMARLEIAGTRARITVENVYEEATLFPHAGEEKRVLTNSIFGGVTQLRETYARRVARLLEQLSNGTPHDRVEGGAGDLVAATRVMEAAAQALEGESVVEVSSAW